MIRTFCAAIAVAACLSAAPAVAAYDHHSFSKSADSGQKVRHGKLKNSRVRGVRTVRHRGAKGSIKSYSKRSGGLSTAGLVAPLAAKAHEIVNVCGSRIISAHRNTRVRGSGRMSLHASGRAVDLQGNPSCIYAQLRSWPGGYSTDYGRVRHVHVSYGGREHGHRFAHYGSRKAKRTRYAHLR